MPTSKQSKGQLDPPVGNGNVFGPKEVSLGPVLVTVTVFNKLGLAARRAALA